MSNKVKPLIDRAQVLQDNEQYEEAYELLKKAYENAPEDPELLESIALCAHVIEKDDEAVEYWEKLMVINPNSEICYSQLIDLYLHRDKYKYYLTRAKLKVVEQNIVQAASDLKKAIDNTTEHDELLFARTMLAQIYEALQKPDKAIDEYLRILDMTSSVETYLKMAELYAKSSKYDSISILKRALGEFNNNEPIKKELCSYAVAVGDFELAYKNATDPITKARALLFMERNDEAQAVLNSITDIDRNNADYKQLTAQLYYNRQEYEKCLKCVEEVEQLNNQNPIIYQMRALTYEALGNHLLASKNWGKFYLLKGNSELALNDFMQAHYADANDTSVINQVIKLAEGNGDKHLSMEFYEKLVKLEPQNKSAVIKLAEFYNELGDYHQAIAYTEALVDLDNKNIDAIKVLAETYDKLKNKQKAVEFYAKYLELAPLTPFSETVKKRLEKLQGENVTSDEGFLEKLIGFFSRK